VFLSDPFAKKSPDSFAKKITQKVTEPQTLKTVMKVREIKTDFLDFR
jgi:hypothetical protein